MSRFRFAGYSGVAVAVVVTVVAGVCMDMFSPDGGLDLTLQEGHCPVRYWLFLGFDADPPPLAGLSAGAGRACCRVGLH